MWLMAGILTVKILRLAVCMRCSARVGIGADFGAGACIHRLGADSAIQ